jgi:hypothetical protein
MQRRTFLRATGLGATALAVPGLLPRLGAAAEPGLLPRLGAAAEHATSGRVASTPDDAPRTPFEEHDGAAWSGHAKEVEFLAEVAARSGRIHLEEIGESVEGRPLHLVTIGTPSGPRNRNQNKPAVLFVGSQHGDEPAGRDAMLITLRDLAFTEDPLFLRQLQDHQILVIPSPNPDGRAANSRTNANGVDTNRDHLILTQPETQAIHTILRDWQPDTIVDHHEAIFVPAFSGSDPVYADLTYLWPRNLNVDPAVRDLSRTLCEEYIGKGARDAGYRADVYGQAGVGPVQAAQWAGGPDEGICRNAVGLRNSLGVLIESNPYNTAEQMNGELGLPADRLRRVAMQVQTVTDTLRFYRDQGHAAWFVSTQAAAIAARVGAERSRPTYWGGADNDPPGDNQVDDPPPCRYELGLDQADGLAVLFALHGIQTRRRGEVTEVSLAQPARPVVPLLLDGRGSRNATAGQPVYDCD